MGQAFPCRNLLGTSRFIWKRTIIKIECSCNSMWKRCGAQGSEGSARAKRRVLKVMKADALDQPLEQLAWLAEPQRKLIQRLGFTTWGQLLEHYPRRYED